MPTTTTLRTQTESPAVNARRQALRSSDSGVHFIEPQSIRIVESENAGAYVLEVRVARADNPLARAYRALAGIGVRLVHTEVRVAADVLVQKLHVLEPDDSRLTPARLLAAARAVALACGANIRPAHAFA